MTAGIQTALSYRLDLMNARGQVVDAWRQVKVQANSLEGVLNVQYDLNSTTPAAGANPTAFSSTRSSNQLTINGVPVHIIEACNGLRMVFALILVSYAFSYGLPLRNSVRFLVLLASPLVAILCNVLRTVPLVWLYGNKSRLIADSFLRGRVDLGQTAEAHRGSGNVRGE